MLIRMTAIFGDGTENWYRAPGGDNTRQVVEELNNHKGEDGPWHGIAKIMPEGVDWFEEADCPAPSESKICTLATEQELINSIVWWCNNCPDDEEDYEFLPEHAQAVTEG